MGIVSSSETEDDFDQSDGEELDDVSSVSGDNISDDGGLSSYIWGYNDDDTSDDLDDDNNSYCETDNQENTDVIFEGILYGMGNPLLDISAKVGEGYLKKYDMKLNDQILAEEKHMPMYEEMTQLFPVEYLAGGATQNSIKIAQWMLREPLSTSFIGCIGSDKYGDILKEKAEGVGVKTAYYRQSKVQTGLCAALICGTHRSLCANLAAANEYKFDHLQQPENWALVEKAKFYYIAGFFLTVSPEAILAVAKHSSQNGKTFTMNLSAPFLCQFFLKPMMEAMPYVDILFGNETEAATFAESQKWETRDVQEIARKIADLPKVNSLKPRTVIITQGAEATVVATGTNDLVLYPIMPLKSEDIVDTNGAGDAFVGGFLSQLVQGKPTKKCVEGGNWAANLVIQRSGCTFPETCTFEQ